MGEGGDDAIIVVCAGGGAGEGNSSESRTRSRPARPARASTRMLPCACDHSPAISYWSDSARP
eukprot:1923349-Rhodomonas_salina.1